MKTALIIISQAGEQLAETLQRELEGLSVYSLCSETRHTRIDSVNDFTRQHFNDFEALVYVGAMGICVRAIAPCVASKHADPAVVCIDSTGRYVVPVLSGHIGGANSLAVRLASVLGAEPVVTTQSDRTGLWALDTLHQRFGWGAEALDASLNHIIALFVGGAATALLLSVRDAGTDWMEAHLPPHVKVFYDEGAIDPSLFKLLICVGPTRPARHGAQLPTLCYIPRVVHVGIGLARQAGPVEEVRQHIARALSEAGIFAGAVKRLATIDIKLAEPVVQAYLADGCEVQAYSADELRVVDVSNPSPLVQQHVGTPSVSEAAALLSAGSPGQLLLPKHKGCNFTVAAAIERTALRQGHIEIVGAGPGDPDLVSVRGRQMLEHADLILYAGSLVPRELTLCAKPGATVRSSASMNLEEQFALMKQCYDRGGFVVRLHTGDPCIYGAIQEQMNYFDQYGMDYHITPGISSFQAAAAALRSQFTIPEKVQSIILTRGEGRTPMPPREQLHLLARSQSTMCIFLSAGIAQRVQDELLQEYAPTTPVAALYHLTWKDERIYRGQLKDLARIVSDNNLTLTTLIVVGEAIDNRQGLSRLYAHEFKHLFRP